MNEASSSSSSRKESVVADVGRRRSSCGYCKSGRRSSVSHGLWAYSLTVQDYQDLLDRGWRRSGCFLYKPEMETTCCPLYTIRLRAENFVPSKEQLRVRKRMNRYLDDALDVKKQDRVANKCGTLSACSNGEKSRVSAVESVGNSNEEKSEEEQLVDNLSEQVDVAVQMSVKDGGLPSKIQYPRGSVKKVLESKKKQLVVASEHLLYTSNISFPIAAAVRRENSARTGVLDSEYLKPRADGNMCSIELSAKVIAEKVVNHLQHLGDTHGLKIRACNGHINFYSDVKLGSSVRQDHYSTCEFGRHCQRTKQSKISEQPRNKKRKMEIRIKRSSFDPVEYALYKKYQMEVHDDTPDKVSESSYKRFLVDTPLIYVPPTGSSDVPPCGFGSFHQQYLIDGKLIAVGVVDILPKCLSSKYLFWDPDYAFLSLGKFSALKEIDWVKENEVHCPSFQYYYLGYYHHNCNKMRYKASYRPSELLCPLRYQWISFSVAKPMLDKSKYAILSNMSSSLGEDSSVMSEEHDNSTGGQHDEMDHGDSNDAHIDGDVEMNKADSESSEDESYPETDQPASAGGVNVANVVINLNGYRLRYESIVFDTKLVLSKAGVDERPWSLHIHYRSPTYILLLFPGTSCPFLASPCSHLSESNSCLECQAHGHLVFRTLETLLAPKNAVYLRLNCIDTQRSLVHSLLNEWCIQSIDTVLSFSGALGGWVVGWSKSVFEPLDFLCVKMDDANLQGGGTKENSSTLDLPWQSYAAFHIVQMADCNFSSVCTINALNLGSVVWIEKRLKRYLH